MKYTSNFKVGSHAVFLKKGKSKKYPNNKYKEVNRVTGHYFLYNVFKTLVKVSKFSNKKYSNKLNNITVSNVSFFSIKRKLTHYTILRAPYRYKKGRYQIGYSRVQVNVSLNLNIPGLIKNSDSFASISQILNSIPLLIDVLSSSSTNIVTLNKLRLLIPLRSDNFFKIRNYRLLKTQ